MEDGSVDDAALEAALALRERAVDAALKAGTAAVALRTALADPPLTSKSAALKDRNAAVITRACIAVGAKDAELATFLETVDAESADVLLKYCYRGLATPAHSALFLKLHGALVDKAGLGACGCCVCVLGCVCSGVWVCGGAQGLRHVVSMHVVVLQSGCLQAGDPAYLLTLHFNRLDSQAASCVLSLIAKRRSAAVLVFSALTRYKEISSTILSCLNGVALALWRQCLL